MTPNAWIKSMKLAGRTPWLTVAWVVAMAISGAASSRAIAQDRTPTMRVVLKPTQAGDEVGAIAVHYRIDNGVVPPGEALTLIAPLVYDTVEGIAERMTDLTVRDADGAIALSIADEPPTSGGSRYYRRWRAERPVRFPVEVSYSALVQPAGSRAGPPLGIRPSAAGISGAGATFLMLAENAGVAHSEVHWDLTRIPQPSLGVSSFGDGDFELAGSPKQLLMGWYMAGPAGRYPLIGDANGFSATWLGAPPWDVEQTMAWSGDVYADLARFFQTPARRYRVFVRVLATPPYGGGTEMTDSFLFSRGPPRPDEVAEPPRRTLVHEMIHGFVGGIEGPAWEQSWFAEGLTSHYTSELQLRGGYFGPDDYLKEINQAAEDYYTNPARNRSAAQIASVGFDDPQIRRLPYRRGQLYFAALDARIKAHSHGRRELDSVMREVFERRRGGWRFDNAAWREIVEREAGPGSAAQFDALVLKGSETLVPPPGMYGPCFVAEPTPYDAAGKPVAGYRWVSAGPSNDRSATCT